MMTWEYYTVYLEANMERDGVANSAEIPPGDHPRFSPHALMPDLNALGAKGWELIHMQPVDYTPNTMVKRESAMPWNWGPLYFCVFKRPTSAV